MLRKFCLVAGLSLALSIGVAAAQSTVLGGNGGAPVRAETPVTEQGLVGRWGDNGDCNAATEFKADNSFTSPVTDDGRWALNGAQLTMESGAGAFVYAARMMNADTIRLTDADGVVKYQRRC